MPSPLEIFKNALIDIKRMGSAEAAPYAEDTELCLTHYNRIVSRWAAQPEMSYFEFSQAFTFTTSQQSYTLGMTGSGADFIITGAGSGVRPPKINRAKLVLTASSPDYEIDLPVIFKAQYETIPNPAQSGQPQVLYFKPTFPMGTLYPVPYPSVTTNQLKLYFGAQLQTVAIGDIGTNIDMPPALEDALTFTLEERICIPFGKKVPDELKIQANGARQIYSQLNDGDPAFISTAIERGDGYPDLYWTPRY